MEVAIKIADARYPNDPAYEKCWLDGQPIEARWDGFKWGKKDREDYLILRTPDDFWTIRGGKDWKVWNKQAEEFKKLFSAVDSQGKQRWEFGFLEEEKRLRMRDKFIDIGGLLNDKKITRTIYDNLYAHGQETGIANIDLSIFDILKQEDRDKRTLVDLKNQGITSGTYQIGTGGGADYATWASFATAVNAGNQMDGDLTGEGQNEETAIATVVAFDTDTNGNTLYLTAESGAEHNGGAYGNGARITCGTDDGLRLSESTPGDLTHVEISKLALDISGSGNIGVYPYDCGDSGDILLNRLLIEGDADSSYPIRIDSGANNVVLRNSIIYGASGEYVRIGSDSEFYNNTVIGLSTGLAVLAGTVVAKNNLVQDCGTDYYGSYGTSAKNISEGATSPDESYRSKDVHTNSVFENYGADDYRLDSGGDATNLQILDDGEDLSGTFTDDIQGQTRSTWYIGASEIVAAGGLSIPRPLSRPFSGPLGGI